jgi:hypothetical protein
LVTYAGPFSPQEFYGLIDKIDLYTKKISLSNQQSKIQIFFSSLIDVKW